jgi:signal transduction histidine kinase
VPAENGTATWHWDPTQYPGTVIKIVATDQNGETVAKQFTVVVVANSQKENQPSSGGRVTQQPGSSNPVFALAASFVKGAKTIIKSLPKPVVVAFPYLLFIVILAEIILQVSQANRELRELRTLRRLLDQEREVGELKQGFLQLVSHYLRTPLTILRSGAEGLPHDGVAPNIVSSIQQTANDLNKTIEDIIASIDNNAAGVVVSAPTVVLDKTQSRQKLIIWLPVAFIGLFAGLFVYLANTVTNYDASVVSTLTKIVIYVVLVSVLYQAWRRLRLRQRDRQNTQAVLADAAAVQASRDQVIRNAADSLKQYIASLDATTQAVPATAANAKFITKGLSQLRTVQNEFLIANHLQGARSKDPYQTVSLKSLFDSAASSVSQAAKAKNVTLAMTTDAPLAVQSTSLATLVLQTLLDNAIAYSAEGGRVEVTAQLDNNGVTELFITDHGQGIPADKLGSLFQPFSKAEGAEVFTHEGMGFSLYPDKLIMTYLGGDITLESKQGEGTSVALAWSVNHA